MALSVLELIVAPCSVRTLLLGSYFAVPLTPSILERSLQLAEVTFVPQIVRSYSVCACIVVGSANITTNNAAMVAYMFLSRFGFIVVISPC